MSQITSSERKRLHQAIQEHDFLHRLQRRIEQLHRVVFHEQTKRLDRQFIRASAEEILVADIVNRHGGSIDGVYYALRKAEDTGRSWDHAINEYATYAHNYYTTPLGVGMRRDLFGDDSHFPTLPAGKLTGLSEKAIT